MSNKKIPNILTTDENWLDTAVDALLDRETVTIIMRGKRYSIDGRRLHPRVPVMTQLLQRLGLLVRR